MTDLDKRINELYIHWCTISKSAREESAKSRALVDAKGNNTEPDPLDLFLLKNEANYIVQVLLPKLIIEKFDKQYNVNHTKD